MGCLLVPGSSSSHFRDLKSIAYTQNKSKLNEARAKKISSLMITHGSRCCICGVDTIKLHGTQEAASMCEQSMISRSDLGVKNLDTPDDAVMIQIVPEHARSMD